jgi:hypothetical protein
LRRRVGTTGCAASTKRAAPSKCHIIIGVVSVLNLYNCVYYCDILIIIVSIIIVLIVSIIIVSITCYILTTPIITSQGSSDCAVVCGVAAGGHECTPGCLGESCGIG